jgi:hypothetical protein
MMKPGVTLLNVSRGGLIDTSGRALSGDRASRGTCFAPRAAAWTCLAAKTGRAVWPTAGSRTSGGQPGGAAARRPPKNTTRRPGPDPKPARPPASPTPRAR